MLVARDFDLYEVPMRTFSAFQEDAEYWNRWPYRFGLSRTSAHCFVPCRGIVTYCVKESFTGFYDGCVVRARWSRS